MHARFAPKFDQPKYPTISNFHFIKGAVLVKNTDREEGKRDRPYLAPLAPHFPAHWSREAGSELLGTRF